MHAPIALWNRYWFPTTSTLNLAGARIVAVAAQLFWFFPGLDYHINLASKNPAFIDPQPMIRAIDALLPREALFNPAGLTTLWWATAVAGVLALVGLWTRPALFGFSLGVCFFVSHGYSYADVHHPQALFVIMLLVLPFAPVGESLSIDALLRRRRGEGAAAAPRSDMAMWPLKLTHVLLALTYFSTGITKLISGGLAWMNGYTLQNHILSDAIARNIPLGVWLAQQHTLCIILGVATILFEVFFFVSILLPRTAPLFFVGGMLFHIGLWFTSGHPFFQHIVMNLILLLFLDPEWFPRRIQGLVRVPAGARGTVDAHQPT